MLFSKTSFLIYEYWDVTRNYTLIKMTKTTFSIKNVYLTLS